MCIQGWCSSDPWQFKSPNIRIKLDGAPKDSEFPLITYFLTYLLIYLRTGL